MHESLVVQVANDFSSFRALRRNAIMHEREHARRNDESCTNASAADEVKSIRSGGFAVGNDTTARSTRLSDAQSSIRQSGSTTGMPSISTAPTCVFSVLSRLISSYSD